MVSAAGGMALSGLLPVCHSFACFLAPRANEHLYDNATERSRVICVASLAGLRPAGPGHSHQGVRDVSAVGAIPGMVVLAPSCEAEVPLALAWAIRDATGSVWLRLESAPRHVPFSSPADHALIPGKGATLRAGRDALFVGYGPALLAEAYHAAELLEQDGLHVGGISLPWVNQVDPSWLARTVGGVAHLLCLDDHYTVGGQADRLAAAIAALGPGPWPRLHSLGLTGLPACGGAAEVPAHHGLDAASLARRVRHAAWG